MLKTYKSLDHQGKLKRSIGVAIFSLFLIVLLFAFPTFPFAINIMLALVLIVVGAYQIQRDYKKSREEEKNKKN